MSPISLVTGANRGIGLEVVRQLAERAHTVYLGCRDLQAGAAAADALMAAGLDVLPVTLDVNDTDTIQAVAAQIGAAHGFLDVLVNNAAIHYDTWERATDADLTTVREALETNVLGAWATTQTLLPLLHRAGHAWIVNVSSGVGSLTDMGGGASGLPDHQSVSQRADQGVGGRAH